MISDSIVKKQRSYSCSIPNSSISISATNSTNSLINSSSSTPPCSGNGNISSINNQRLGNIEKMFETFQQSPSGDFKPTFYNPFEIKHRRRTTKSQFKVGNLLIMRNIPFLFYFIFLHEFHFHPFISISFSIFNFL